MKSSVLSDFGELPKWKVADQTYTKYIDKTRLRWLHFVYNNFENWSGLGHESQESTEIKYYF